MAKRTHEETENQITGYIHNTSELRTSRSNTRYFDGVLQTGFTEFTRFVSFSPEKHHNIMSAETTKTPVKLSNVKITPKDGSKEISITEPPACDEGEIFVAEKIEIQKSSKVEYSTIFSLTKRHMTIDSKYETNYEWLYFSCSKNGHLCKYCEMFGRKLNIVSPGVASPFLSGTMLGDHPVRKLDAHENTLLHRESAHTYIKATEGVTDLTVPEMVKAKMRKGTSEVEIQRNRRYIACLVSTTNLVVHKHWSLDSVSDLIDHMASANCSDVTNFTKLNTLRYTSSTSITDIISALSVYFEQQLLDEIQASDIITVFADESTDEANRNQFAILIHFLDSGKIDDHFVGVVNVKKADAATLTDAISTFLQSKEIDIRKVMFLEFDGCNTMSGEQNGMQRRFKNLVPHSQYVNCRSNKLALCVKHLMNHFKVLEEVDAVLLAVYKLFEYSPQKFAVFKEVQYSYAMRELVMVRAAATRWLPHAILISS